LIEDLKISFLHLLEKDLKKKWSINKIASRFNDL